VNARVLGTLLRAWRLTAVSDGVYASSMTVFAYHGTFSKLWQGVASTLLGPSAMEGGTRTVLIGLLMHAGVALAWSSVFLALALMSPRLRRFISTPGGIVATAIVYGPVIWIMMSCAVIPFLTGRPPTFAARWFIALVGHMIFVALPMVATIGRGLDARALTDGRVVERMA
jgi:hypothetical protein